MIAATNTPNSLDKALIRPGRFDRHVPVPLPDVRGRTAILKVHMKEVQMSPQINPEIIARGTPGFSGAVRIFLTFVYRRSFLNLPYRKLRIWSIRPLSKPPRRVPVS